VNNDVFPSKDTCDLSRRIALGTYRFGQKEEDFDKEAAFIRTCFLRYGIKTFDTAEMYSEGRAQIVLGQALKGLERRDLFIINKVLPQNASRIRETCCRSLKLMGMDYFDLYLLHWRDTADLSSVVAQMEDLVRSGLIRHWGVSNFDVSDLKELLSVPGGERCYANQVLYNLGSRGIEFDLMPFMQARSIRLEAYSVLFNEASLRKNVTEKPSIGEVARKHGVSEEAVMLAFVLSHPDCLALFKTQNLKHLESDLGCLDFRLDKDDFSLLEKDFPKPEAKKELAKI
jgi:diketogulonate reductase-like aldo/keto reductase